ncbi:MAG: hypothetical protein IPK26_27930 [Planctomycetes bacterium]|nr:hypothetical protein [Planctomycetota bacterium]
MHNAGPHVTDRHAPGRNPELLSRPFRTTLKVASIADGNVEFRSRRQTLQTYEIIKGYPHTAGEQDRHGTRSRQHRVRRGELPRDVAQHRRDDFTIGLRKVCQGRLVRRFTLFGILGPFVALRWRHRTCSEAGRHHEA